MVVCALASTRNFYRQKTRCYLIYTRIRYCVKLYEQSRCCYKQLKNMYGPFEDRIGYIIRKNYLKLNFCFSRAQMLLHSQRLMFASEKICKCRRQNNCFTVFANVQLKKMASKDLNSRVPHVYRALYQISKFKTLKRKNFKVHKMSFNKFL